MIEQLLLDAHGECRAFPAGEALGPSSGVAEALAAAADATRLLTDWGPGAVMGVATVAGTASTAAALLEKRLRDQGETDDISHLLVHQSQTRGGSTELVYTAVPVQTWLRYQQLAADQQQLILLHDWTRTLIEWSRRRELENGPLLVMHPLGLDVLLLSAGRVQALERLRVFAGEADAWGRLGARVAAMIRQHGSQENSAALPAVPVAMWVLQGVEAELQPLLGGLGQMPLTECWAEAPAAVQAALDGAPSPVPVQVQALDVAALITAMPLRHAVGRRLDQAAAWAERRLPALALASLALSVIIGGTAAFMHYRNAQALAMLTGQSPSQAVWSALGESVQQADLLAERQKDERQWLQQRLDASKLPDMEMVMAHVRRSLPPGLVVVEVGLVVEKDKHLLTIVGHASGVEDALRSESVFAQALQTDGFALRKRDLLLRDGQPGFKLSMTWSAS
jgi:hypothetical protein